MKTHKRVILIIISLLLMACFFVWMTGCLFAVGQLYGTYDFLKHIADMPLAFAGLAVLLISSLTMFIYAVVKK